MGARKQCATIDEPMTDARQKSLVLIFVEDPGAANFVAELPGALLGRGHRVHLATAGAATTYLRQQGIAVHPLAQQCDLREFLSDLAPRVVVVGTAENPDSPGLELTAIAAARRVPTVGVVDSSTHPGFRFRGRNGDPLRFCPDQVIVPDTVCRDGFVALGLGADRIIVAGHPHWDRVRSADHTLRQTGRAELQKRLFHVPAAGRLVVVFAAEISDGMDPAQFQVSGDYTLHGSGKRSGRTEIVIEEFLSAVAPRRSELHLVLRLHPKQSPADLAEFHREFDAVSQAEPSLEVVYAADAVVGMTSMLMVEAALMGRPTFAILPRALEAGWLPTLAAGATPCASDRASVRLGMSRTLDELRPASAPLLDRLFPPGALERTVDTLETMLSR